MAVPVQPPARENPQAGSEASAPAKIRTRTGKIVIPPFRPEPGMMEIRLFDGSALRGKLLDEKIPFETPFGKLMVPPAEIRQIDFGLRLSEEAARKIQAAVERLGHPNYDDRETAMGELAAYRQRALRAIELGTRHKDVEVVYRCEMLLEALKKHLPRELAQIRDADILHAGESKIAGRIALARLRVRTASFGEQQIELHELTGLRSLGNLESPTNEPVLPEPQSLHIYQNQIGKSFLFRVTGRQGGNLWGTGIYTLDSTLGAAVVHAGILRLGETDVVRVNILPSPPVFVGSFANGMQSNPFGPYPAAYSVQRP